MTRILITEDEPRISSFLEKGLRSHGFITEVATEMDTIFDLVFSDGFDLLLLDLGLSKKDGLSLLEELRGQGATLPIIILTARDDIKDKVAGLEGGADDYMTKPFRFEELLARIRLRLRNPTSSPSSGDMILEVGDLCLDLRTHQVSWQNQTVELSLREFILLETLMRHQGQIMSREQLLDHAWGYSHDSGSNVVDVYISYLRKKLESRLIETVRGMGYRFR